MAVSSRLAGVLRAWPAILLAAALPLFLGFAYLSLVPASYRATAQVFADGDIGNATNGDARRSHLDLVTSRSVLDRVAVRKDLAEDFASLRAPGLAARFAELLSRIRGETAAATGNVGQNAARLGAALSVTPSGQANIIDISVAGASHASSARLANAVAEAFVDEVTSLARPAPSRVGNARGQDLRRRLREAETALAGGNAGNAASEAARIAGLKARLEEATRMISAGRDSAAVADALRTPDLERLKARYEEAKAQETSLAASLGQRHPSTIAASRHAADSARLLSEAVRLSLTALKTETEQAVSGDPASAAAAQDDARRNLDRIRAEYDAYLKTPEGAAEGATARIIRRAEPQAGNGASSAPMIWRAAFALAALLGLLAAVRAYRRAPKAVPGSAAFRERRRVPRAPQGERAGQPPAQVGGMGEPAERSVQAPARAMQDMVSEISDKAWRQALQTLLVAGADREEMAATALAMAGQLARKHLRVLLLDADEANPYFSRKLAAAPIAGQVVLHGQNRVLAALQGEGGEPLWLAPALSSLDNRQRDREPLTVPGLAGHFDILVLVGPDMRATEDVARLAHAADRVIVPASVGQARPAASIAAALELPADKVHLLRAATPQGRGGHVIRLDLA